MYDVNCQLSNKTRQKDTIEDGEWKFYQSLKQVNETFCSSCVVNLNHINVYAIQNWANEMNLYIFYKTPGQHVRANDILFTKIIMSRFRVNPTEIYDVTWNPGIISIFMRFLSYQYLVYQKQNDSNLKGIIHDPIFLATFIAIPLLRDGNE